MWVVVSAAEMSLKALKEEMVAFMIETPPADTSVRWCRSLSTCE